jgi:hypothetical protein
VARPIPDPPPVTTALKPASSLTAPFQQGGFHPARSATSAATVIGVTASDERTPITGERLRMLRSLGYGELMHDSHVPFLSHLIGTRRLLVEWECRPALCDAGLFHSVYGTEYFEPEVAASRDDVRAIIGPDAERVAWLWCNIKRDTLDPRTRSVQLRHDDSVVVLDGSEVADIATLWAADTVEQIGRMADDERAFARGLSQVLPHASERARRALAELGLRRESS